MMIPTLHFVRHASVTRGVDALFEVVILVITCVVGRKLCVPKSESNRGASKVVVVNTTSGWPRPHRSLFFRPPSCGLSSSILSGPSFSTFLSTSPILPCLLSLPFHHHTGPVHFFLSCLFYKFCPFNNHLYFSISSSKEPRWLIVYAIRSSHSFVATYSHALCHMSRFVSYHCETGLVSNAPRT